VAVAEEKSCRSCGRQITWRKKWARDWDQVIYCSDKCRRRGVSEHDRELEVSIRRLLAGRLRAGLISDSDAARAVAPDGWSELVEPARRAARRLTVAGEVEIIQQGLVVDPPTAKGSFSIRRRAAG